MSMVAMRHKGRVILSYESWQTPKKDTETTGLPSHMHEQETRNWTSKQIWILKDNNKPFRQKWKIIKQCTSYHNITKKCNLCLFQKSIIICKKFPCSLNKQNKLFLDHYELNLPSDLEELRSWASPLKEYR